MGTIFSLIGNKDRNIFILLMMLIIYFLIMEIWSFIYLATTKDDNKSKINYLRSLNTTPTVIHSIVITIYIGFKIALFLFPPFRMAMMVNDAVSSTDYEISFLNKLGIFVCSIITFVAQGQINNLSEKQLNTNDLIYTKALNVIVLLVLSFFMILTIHKNSIKTSQK
jgi:hypothetical protein